jgi:hypothetical protein
MRATIFRACVLCLAVLAVVLASPAAAQPTVPRGCKLLYGDMQTTWSADEGIEMGWVDGTISGGVYLRYSDKDPRIDPASTKPNLIFSMKEGNIELWVTSDSVFHDGVVLREFNTLKAVGTGTYANMRISVAVTGKFVLDKEGSYLLEGLVCPPIPKPPKK